MSQPPLSFPSSHDLSPNSSILQDCQSTLEAIAFHLSSTKSPRENPISKWQKSALNRSVELREDSGKRVERVLKRVEAENRDWEGGKRDVIAGMGRFEEELKGNSLYLIQSDVSTSSPRLRINRESVLSKSFSLSHPEETYHPNLRKTGQISQLSSEKSALERQLTAVSSLLEHTSQELAQERAFRKEQESEIRELKQALEALRQDYMRELEAKTLVDGSTARRLEEETNAHARTKLELKQAEAEIDRNRRDIGELREKNEDLAQEVKKKTAEIADLTRKYEKLQGESEDSLYRLAVEAAKSRAEATDGLKGKLRLIDATRNADRERHQAEVSRLKLLLSSAQVPSEALEGLQSLHKESSRALESRLVSLSGRLQAQGEGAEGRKSLPLAQLVGRLRAETGELSRKSDIGDLGFGRQ
jgi:hypothetical protein